MGTFQQFETTLPLSTSRPVSRHTPDQAPADAPPQGLSANERYPLGSSAFFSIEMNRQRVTLPLTAWLTEWGAAVRTCTHSVASDNEESIVTASDGSNLGLLSAPGGGRKHCRQPRAKHTSGNHPQYLFSQTHRCYPPTLIVDFPRPPQMTLLLNPLPLSTANGTPASESARCRADLASADDCYQPSGKELFLCGPTRRGHADAPTAIQGERVSTVLNPGTVDHQTDHRTASANALGSRRPGE
jgi:hypothetical protein